MFATVMYGPGDVRHEKFDDPKVIEPTNAIIKLSATCICGSDLWPYRGLKSSDGAAHMGHAYCGVVVEVGSDVRTIKGGELWSARSASPTIPVRTATLVFSHLACSELIEASCLLIFRGPRRARAQEVHN